MAEKEITLEQLEMGIKAIGDRVKEPRDLLLDLRKRKLARQGEYWAAIHGIKFRRYGWFSEGRGRPVVKGDRYGYATGETRRETNGSFDIERIPGGMALEMGPTNDHAVFFNATLVKRRISKFSQGILPYYRRDQKEMEDITGTFMERVVRGNL